MGSHDPTMCVPRGEAHGDIDDQAKLAYCCPTHERFKALTPRNRIPDAVECRHWMPDHGIFRGGECCSLSLHESSGGQSATSIESVSHG